jgi:predicted  nucleic acid-binding Zn-ribbon protein
MMVMDDLAVRIRDGIKKMKEEAELASAKAERSEAGLAKLRGEFLNEVADLKKQVAGLQKVSSAPRPQGKQPGEDRLAKIEKSVLEMNNDLELMQKVVDDHDNKIEKLVPLIGQTVKGTKDTGLSDRVSRIESDLKSVKGVGDVSDLQSDISRLRKETDEKFRDVSAKMENLKNFSTDIVKVKEMQGVKSQLESLKKERIDFMKQMSRAQETFKDLNERVGERSSVDESSDMKFKSEVGAQITELKSIAEGLKRRMDDHEYDAIGSRGPRADDSVMQLEDRIAEMERSLSGARQNEPHFEREREADNLWRRSDNFRDDPRSGYGRQMERQGDRRGNIEDMATEMDRIKQRLDVLRQGLRSDMSQPRRPENRRNGPVVIE